MRAPCRALLYFQNPTPHVTLKRVAPATHAFSAPRARDSFDARLVHAHFLLTLIEILDECLALRFSPYFLALAKNLAKTDSESMPMTPIAYVMKPMLKTKTAV